MTATAIPAEPADNTFVIWFDQNNDPWAVFHREDRHAVGTNRWMNTDQFDNNDGEPWAWSALCEEMDGLDGPHLLTLVRSESPAVSAPCDDCSAGPGDTHRFPCASKPAVKL